jgi:two-component system sensor histidine kinase RegB
VNGGRSEAVDKFLREVVDKWRMLRPGVKLECQWRGTQPPPKISKGSGLGHAILSLLNNAADASPEAVGMQCRWNPGELKILILDRGPGIPSELGDMLGKRFLTTKGDKGTGIGLLLAKTVIEGAGGSLELSNRPGGGARAEVLLPLEQARSADDSDQSVTAPSYVRNRSESQTRGAHPGLAAAVHGLKRSGNGQRFVK